MKGTVTVREADRAAVIMAVVEKRLKQREAADRLGLSVRQVKRLARRHREQGAAGCAVEQGVRGRGSAGGAAAGTGAALDFGPAFAVEKLLEEHGLALSREVPRQWMAKDGL